MVCFGDSGGPQVRQRRDGRWELIGVTSGPGAPKAPCSQGPGLYTSAPAYRGWIDKTVKADSVTAVASDGSDLTETGAAPCALAFSPLGAPPR
jgi:secreted trypsin-like serine protease